METIVCNRLLNYLEKYNILFKHQYGFRSKHSTIHPILHLLKGIADVNEKNYQTYFIGCNSLIDPKQLTLLIMIFCYINYVTMELEASVINGSPVTSLIVNNTLK